MTMMMQRIPGAAIIFPYFLKISWKIIAHPFQKVNHMELPISYRIYLLFEKRSLHGADKNNVSQGNEPSDAGRYRDWVSHLAGVWRCMKR